MGQVADERGAWRTYGEKTLYDNRWVRLGLVDVEAPNGERWDYHVVHFGRIAIGMIVNEDDDTVLMLWRYRFATDQWGYELLGGLVEEGEDPAATAAREAVEESGWAPVGDFEKLISLEPLPGNVTAPVDVFLWRRADQVSEPTDTEEGRFVQVNADRRPAAKAVPRRSTHHDRPAKLCAQPAHQSRHGSIGGAAAAARTTGRPRSDPAVRASRGGPPAGPAAPAPCGCPRMTRRPIRPGRPPVRPPAGPVQRPSQQRIGPLVFGIVDFADRTALRRTGEFDRNSSITKGVSRSHHPRRQLAPPRRVAPGRRGRRGFFATRTARRSILNAIVDRLDYL